MIAEENARRNGLRPLLFGADVTDPAIELPDAEVVVANIALTPIVALGTRYAGALAAASAHPHTVVLAGLLDEQVAPALAAFGGYRRRRNSSEGEWNCVVLEAPHAGERRIGAGAVDACAAAPAARGAGADAPRVSRRLCRLQGEPGRQRGRARQPGAPRLPAGRRPRPGRRAGGADLRRVTGEAERSSRQLRAGWRPTAGRWSSPAARRRCGRSSSPTPASSRRPVAGPGGRRRSRGGGRRVLEAGGDGRAGLAAGDAAARGRRDRRRPMPACGARGATAHPFHAEGAGRLRRTLLVLRRAPRAGTALEPCRRRAPSSAARAAVAAGCGEIVLSGIDVGAYRDPRSGGGLAGLVGAPRARCPGLRRLRLSSIEPRHLTADLIEALGRAAGGPSPARAAAVGRRRRAGGHGPPVHVAAVSASVAGARAAARPGPVDRSDRRVPDRRRRRPSPARCRHRAGRRSVRARARLFVLAAGRARQAAALAPSPAATVKARARLAREAAAAARSAAAAASLDAPAAGAARGVSRRRWRGYSSTYVRYYLKGAAARGGWSRRWRRALPRRREGTYRRTDVKGRIVCSTDQELHLLPHRRRRDTGRRSWPDDEVRGLRRPRSGGADASAGGAAPARGLARRDRGAARRGAGRMLRFVAEVARRAGVARSGYRVVANTGPDARPGGHAPALARASAADCLGGMA